MESPESGMKAKADTPHIFTDKGGKTYLFYQGNRTKGRDWYLSQRRVTWHKGMPRLEK